MKVLLISRHAFKPMNGTSARVWKLAERFAEDDRFEVRTQVVPSLSSDTRSSPPNNGGSPSAKDRSSSRNRSFKHLWKRGLAKLRTGAELVSSDLPSFSRRNVSWDQVISDPDLREFSRSVDVVIVHQASLIHLCLQVPSTVTVIVLLDEDKSRFAPKRARLLQTRQTRRLYRRVIDRSSLVVFLTEEEREYVLSRARVDAVPKAIVFPLGIDMREYSNQAINDGSADKIPSFDVGVFGSVTNARRARPILAALETARDKGYTWKWVIVGQVISPWKELIEGLGAKCTQRVADMRPYYLGAGTVLVPAEQVPGMKTTLLEALSLGRPVVATTAAAVGTGLVDGEHLLLAPTAPDAVQRIAQLRNEPDLAGRIAAAGQDYVRSAFDSEQITDEILRACLQKLDVNED